MDGEITSTAIKIFVGKQTTGCLTIVLVAGWIIWMDNLSVLRACIIEMYLMSIHIMITAAKQITAAAELQMTI